MQFFQKIKRKSQYLTPFSLDFFPKLTHIFFFVVAKKMIFFCQRSKRANRHGANVCASAWSFAWSFYFAQCTFCKATTNSLYFSNHNISIKETFLGIPSRSFWLLIYLSMNIKCLGLYHIHRRAFLSVFVNIIKLKCLNYDSDTLNHNLSAISITNLSLTVQSLLYWAIISLLRLVTNTYCFSYSLYV